MFADDLLESIEKVPDAMVVGFLAKLSWGFLKGEDQTV